MIKKFLLTDERTAMLTGKIAVVFLGLTQTALLISILYRRFILQQNPEQYNDIRIILFFSVFGYIAIRLYYGAVLPVLSIKVLAGIYISLVTLLFVILSIWMGVPNLSNWENTYLPIFAGPAVLLLFYWIIAKLSVKRSEKELFDD